MAKQSEEVTYVEQAVLNYFEALGPPITVNAKTHLGVVMNHVNIALTQARQDERVRLIAEVEGLKEQAAQEIADELPVKIEGGDGRAYRLIVSRKSADGWQAGYWRLNAQNLPVGKPVRVAHAPTIAKALSGLRLKLREPERGRTDAN